MLIQAEEKKNVLYVEFINSNNKDLINDSFNNFYNIWNNYYKKKQDFYFIFDTTKLKTDNYMLLIESSYKLLNIINSFENIKPVYLKASIIIIDNNIINNLFNTIFLIKKPISDIFLTKTNAQSNILIEYIFSKTNIDNYIKLNNINHIKC